MTEVNIPAEAYEAGRVSVSSWLVPLDAIGAAQDVIHAAAPLIVAAELRRLAKLERKEEAKFREYLSRCEDASPAYQMNAACLERHSHARLLLESRADELEAK